jgi:predicted HicB family RNase H-like nuclease
MKNTAELLTRAEELARSAETWADLANALFDPEEGLIARAYPDRADREAFMKTDEFKRIHELLSEAMQRHGVVAGATPKKSGRFVVRLPRSLHAALEREAAVEGVSLNQLVVAKLAVSLSDLARVTTS